ncbi:MULTISPECIES: hypothetical protein [unclassified Roseitalea]|uniref:hypothetical protein n=1 Tax=unclassified Roseitalea TaxID=2639107 RepID=UPI00273DB350|nr:MULTISPECIES: hypothetical protein [unclassified Roseitalea]
MPDQVQADNQICYTALCGMKTECVSAEPRRLGILTLAITALRRSASRKGFCVDCPYRGGCADPDNAELLNARPLDVHVPINWPQDRAAT